MTEPNTSHASSSPFARPADVLDFPRADGPTPAAVAWPAGSTSGAVPAEAGVRSFSVAMLLATVLVLLTGWAIAVSFYFNHAGLTRLLESEGRDRADRAARAVQDALRLDIANLESVVQSLHVDSAMAAALAAAQPDLRALQFIAQRVRDLTSVDAVTVYDRNGHLLLHSGSPLVSRPSLAADAERLATAARGPVHIAFVPEQDLLTLTVRGPVLLAGSQVGSIALKRVIHAGYLRGIAQAAGVELGLGDAQRLLASSGSVVLPHGSADERQRVLRSSSPQFIRMDGPYDVLMQPLEVLDQPLMLTVLVAKSAQQPAIVQGREHLALVALLTMLAALLVGVVLTRYLVQPIRRLTERAGELAMRYAGRSVQLHGNEFDTLVASFDAMTEALLGHSDRLKQAHLTELQNSLELQRQYALMRLLRGLATIANEAGSVHEALRGALHEIGAYLDWPLGRFALLPDEGSFETDAPRSDWFVRDEARYARFIEVSNGLTIARSSEGLLGRAYISGMAQWVTDLRQLIGWNRREVAAEAGLHSGLAIPVVAHGHVMAFLEFYADRRIEASAEMMDLVEAITAELSRLAERHRVELDLRRREAEARRLALVASNTEKVVLLLDTLGRVQWVNEAFTRWTGHSPEEARGRLVHNLIGGPETDRAIVSLVGKAVVSGEAVKFEVVAYNRDGERGEHEVEGRPLLDEHGAYVQYALLATDITSLKRTQTALHANEIFFRALFENSPVPVSIQDRSFRLLRVNRAYAQMLGCTPAEVEGQDPITFTHPDDVPAQRQSRAQTLQANASDEVERRLISRDGKLVHVRIHVAHITGQSGEPLLLGVVENITDIRTNERMLREAKDVAESASRAKSQFLANMSHEIRTPMNGVLGMTELLLGTPLSDKQRRFAEAVYRSGENLLGIINDILDFSKIEAGKLELESVDFDLPTLVEDVFELLAPRAHDKRLELAHHVAHDVPRVVLGDPTRLRQVLTNLVGNAIKFTERGEVVVEVRLAAPSPTALRAAGAGTAPQSELDLGAWVPRVLFEVRDTGIGVKPEALERLFSSFMQADQSMSRRYGGTGLGLAISRQLVELMGGQIGASSRYGEGSVFRFEVPLPVGAAASDVPAAPQLLIGRRVIVVEDNPTNRSILEEQLRRLGVEVATAEQGLQAIEMMRAAARAGAPFDAAIIDMKMPVMDGLTLATRLRRDPLLSGTGLLLLTSLTGGVEMRQAHDSGVDACLAKPVRGRELVQALYSLLARRVPPARHDAGSDPGAYGGTRVLLVEDNPVNQEVARVMLQDLGCTVGLAANGRQALLELAQAHYDLVLMDCQMPEMDGFEAVRRLRDRTQTEYSWTTRADVPVVALTANALAGDAARCLEAGFSDYLAKPFKQQQLSQLLGRWLGQELVGAHADSDNGPPAAVARDAGTTRADATATEAASLDCTVIDRLRDMERRGASGLLARLVATYMTTAARLIAQADAAALREDTQQMRHAVHTLKSSSANLGASALAQGCAELEEMLGSGRVLAACQRWPAVRIEYERVVPALEALARAATLSSRAPADVATS